MEFDEYHDPLIELIDGADEAEAARWKRKFDLVKARARLREAELLVEIDRLQGLIAAEAADISEAFLRPLIDGDYNWKAA